MVHKMYGSNTQFDKRAGIAAFELSRHDKGISGWLGLGGNRLTYEDTAAIREYACRSRSVGDLQKAASSRLSHRG